MNVLSFSRQIYIEKSKVPLLINSCEDDEMFPKSTGEAADEKFANFAPGYHHTYYEGVSHGFAVRDNLVRVHIFFIQPFQSSFYMAEQARSKGCQGRLFQGVRGVADQISAVKRCL